MALSSRKSSFLLVLALLLSCVLLVTVSLQKRRLEEGYRTLAWRVRTLTTGTYVPTVRAPGGEGDSVTVAPEGRRQVLIFLTTTCEYCRASLPAWRELVAAVQARPEEEVIVVSMDPAEATVRYLESAGLDARSALFGDPRLRSYYRAHSVPQTVILDGNGQVRYARPEVFTRAAADSLLDRLDELMAQGPGAERE